MSVPTQHRDTLRRLATEVAEIAAKPVHKEKADMWRRLNGLKPVRPLVWINEVCWEEMPAEAQPTIEGGDRLLRSTEEYLRQTLYQWKHFPADMVVDDFVVCPIAVSDTGFGLSLSTTESDGHKGARDYKPVIRELEDVQKIKDPEVKVDANETDRRFTLLNDLIGDIIPIKKRGMIHTWFAPVDDCVMLYGIEELYMDLVDRPEVLDAAIGRIADSMISRYRQFEKLGVLELNNCNVRVSSGGLGYTDELPQKDFAGKARMIDMWGHCSPQIFCSVSPEMHERFALKHEIRILENFGLNGYGCCEPLHKKIGILRKVPRLRRISMSPFVDVAEGAAAIGQEFIFSSKPNPSMLAMDAWDEAFVRRSLGEVLEKTRGLHVEIILKDIHTTRNDPTRIDRWERIAMEMVGAVH